MTDLDDRVRTLLRRARSLHGATDQDRERILNKLASRIPEIAATTAGATALAVGTTQAAAASGGVGKVAASGAATTALAGGLLTAKLGVIVGIAAAAGAVTLGVHFHRVHVTAPPPARTSATSGAIHRAAPKPQPRAVTPPPETPAPPSASTASAAFPPAVIPSQPKEPAPAESVVPPPPSASQPGNLEDELALLRRAQRALHDGMPSVAIANMDELDRRYPASSLREEADVVRVLAFCDQGKRAQAAQLARAILANNPQTVHASRLRRSCALAPDPVENLQEP